MFDEPPPPRDRCGRFYNHNRGCGVRTVQQSKGEVGEGSIKAFLSEHDVLHTFGLCGRPCAAKDGGRFRVPALPRNVSCYRCWRRSNSNKRTEPDTTREDTAKNSDSPKTHHKTWDHQHSTHQTHSATSGSPLFPCPQGQLNQPTESRLTCSEPHTPFGRPNALFLGFPPPFPLPPPTSPSAADVLFDRELSVTPKEPPPPP